LPQHVSGTNMPIIVSTINKWLPLLGGYTRKAWGCAALGFLEWALLGGCGDSPALHNPRVWPPKSGSHLLIVLMMMGILVPETCWGNKTAYFVAFSLFFTFTMSTMHGHMNIKLATLVTAIYHGLAEEENLIIPWHH
jgi:hypothetical protein